MPELQDKARSSEENTSLFQNGQKKVPVLWQGMARIRISENGEYKMKCPRCDLAELNGGKCPMCHYETKQGFINLPNLRKRLEGHWERDHALRKIWQMNLNFYAQTKAFVLMIAIVIFIAAMVLLIEAANFLVSIFAAWFALMAMYDFWKMHKEKGK